ncbi:hypothetical protein [Rhodococcus sp. NPDC056516]|uniref:hypothetical protein n=1 Tax=Rhodococcus sp. NPDC056516 TaxID=3345847 RepID=UPI00366D143B
MPEQSDTPKKPPVDKKRLARIFGDVFPETTSDERGPEGSSRSSDDDWLRSQRPPHHGG